MTEENKRKRRGDPELVHDAYMKSPSSKSSKSPCYCEHCIGLREARQNIDELLRMHNEF